jgi:allantoinase
VTDHSPSTPNLKCIGSGDFSKAWGGIASLQLGLAVVWTEARARGGRIEDIAKWMCANTSKLIGLEKTKGAIIVGADADFCVWDPDAEFTVRGSALEHRHKLTPYDGRVAFGKVATTILRGETIFDRGELKTPARGKHLCKTN